MYKVYAIKSKVDNRIYVGISKNIQNRLKQHNYGQVRSTKPFRPWKIIFFRYSGKSRQVARNLEKYYKSGCGKEYLKKL